MPPRSSFLSKKKSIDEVVPEQEAACNARAPQVNVYAHANAVAAQGLRDQFDTSIRTNVSGMEHARNNGLLR